MASIGILGEVRQLYDVSDRLDSLPDQHAVVSDESTHHHLDKCSQHARLLEVLLATKRPAPGFDQPMRDF